MRKFFYEFLEALHIAFDALRANKLRGTLTTLGILIGIASVITTMTITNGIGRNFEDSISSMGSDVFYVTRTPWVHMGDDWREIQKRPRLESREANGLKTVLAGYAAVNPTTSDRMTVKYRSNTMESIPVSGTTENQMLVSVGAPEYGRFITAFDSQFKREVCVIGKSVRDKLFGDIDPINKYVRINGQRFQVIGVMEELGSASFFGGPNFDRQIYVPLSAFLKSFGSANRSFTFAVKAPVPELMDEFEYQLVGEMRKIRKLKPAESDDFSVNKMTTLIDAYNQLMGVVLLVGLVITSISLFVGGMGVMNIMFVSVTERTREIGLRKAIGARRRAIMTQFMLEASVICLLGGTIGLLIASGLTMVLNEFVMPASISPNIVIVAIVTSILVGMLAGIVPAFRAAKLHPIEALRYE
ncbi:MAG: ABC transporter permease [Calditrichia bacterium]